MVCSWLIDKRLYGLGGLCALACGGPRSCAPKGGEGETEKRTPSAVLAVVKATTDLNPSCSADEWELSSFLLCLQSP